MSLTSLTWVALAGTLVLLALRRPAYAVAFYMMTFFAAPEFWWWGGELPQVRYAVLSGLVLLGSVLLHRLRSAEDPLPRFSKVHYAALGIAANATVVHFAVASFPLISANNYIELLKYVLLFFLICGAIRNRAGLRIAIMAIAIGAAYIGYEATINERGDFRGSRLEDIGAPGADTSNSLASVMLLTVPLVGSLFVKGKPRHKIAAIFAAPMVLNVVLLCNSRGAFLGLIGAGATFLLLARGAARKRAVLSLALGSVALFLLLGDPEILRRFSTTFVGSEERDRSAASRLEFWQAGLLMIQDFPLGDGGGSFKFVRGAQYLQRVVGNNVPDRSLHNGYLTEATEWGVQGLLLRLIFISASCLMAYRTTVRCQNEGRVDDAMMGLCLLAGQAGYLITAVFGSFISNEWGYWIVALLVRYSDLYRIPEPVTATSPVAQEAPRFQPLAWTAASNVS